MSKDLWVVVYMVLYFLCFLAAVVGIGIFVVKRRRERPPLDFKLLRGPGESLRQRLNKFNDDFLQNFGLAALTPLAIALIVFVILVWLTPHMRLRYGLIIVAGTALPTLALTGTWSVRQLIRYRNDQLGYLGERAVGEALAKIEPPYRVYHDIPAEVSGRKFNVDHAVVGPNGLFAVETKTRRKGRVRPGFEAHKVAYDGKRLIWPWAEDTFGLEKAIARARWLEQWLNERTGLGLVAQPVLVLPGWYVVPQGMGPVLVTNHKLVVGAIARANRYTLDECQIDLISRLLETLCRDVED